MTLKSPQTTTGTSPNERASGNTLFKKAWLCSIASPPSVALGKPCTWVLEPDTLTTALCHRPVWYSSSPKVDRGVGDMRCPERTQMPTHLCFYSSTLSLVPGRTGGGLPQRGVQPHFKLLLNHHLSINCPTNFLQCQNITIERRDIWQMGKQTGDTGRCYTELGSWIRCFSDPLPRKSCHSKVLRLRSQG